MKLPADRIELTCDTPQLHRQAHAFALRRQQLRAAAADAETVTYGRQIAGRTACERQTRDRARDIRRRPQAVAHVTAQSFLLDQEADGIEPVVDLLGIAQRACKPRGKLSRTGTRHRAIDRSEQASLLVAGGGTRELQARAARGIDQKNRPRACPLGRAQHRLAAYLRQVHVLEDGTDRGQLWPRKPAEAAELCHLQLLLQARFAGEAVEVSRRYRRCRCAGKLDPRFEASVGKERIGKDHLAGAETHELSRQVRSLHLSHLELARRDVERGERHGSVSERTGAARRSCGTKDCGQIVASLGIEKRVLGQGSRRDEAHHVAAHHRFGAALPRFGGILELLGDGHAKADLDKALQILVRAMDRHPAHGDVLPQMFAPLGEHDAKRCGGGNGILEEQLVEIAHAIPEQAVGVRCLNLKVLGHRRTGLTLRRGLLVHCGLLRGRGGGRRGLSFRSCPFGRHGPRVSQPQAPSTANHHVSEPPPAAKAAAYRP